MTVENAAREIIEDLRDRKGLKTVWDDISSGVQAEIGLHWQAIIERVAAAAREEERERLRAALPQNRDLLASSPYDLSARLPNGRLVKGKAPTVSESRVTCPHCGEYERYELWTVTDEGAYYECGACGRPSVWERAPDGWQPRKPKESDK